MSSPEANALITEFVAKKSVKVSMTPVAELLIPKDHGFGTRRVPMKTNYFEAFNLDNVHLIDLNKTAIEEIMPEGIRCSDKLYELDLIIYATGSMP